MALIAQETSITKRKIIMAMAPVCLVLLYVSYSYARSKTDNSSNHRDTVKYTDSHSQEYNDDTVKWAQEYEKDRKRDKTLIKSQPHSQDSTKTQDKHKPYTTEHYSVDEFQSRSVLQRIHRAMSVDHLQTKVQQQKQRIIQAKQQALDIGYKHIHDLAMQVHLLICKIHTQVSVSEDVHREYDEITHILQVLCAAHEMEDTPMDFIKRVAMMFADKATNKHTQEEHNAVDILMDTNLHSHVRALSNKIYEHLVKLREKYVVQYEHNVQLKKYTRTPLENRVTQIFAVVDYTYLATAHVLEEADDRYAMVPSHFIGLEGSVLFAHINNGKLTQAFNTVIEARDYHAIQYNLYSATFYAATKPINLVLSAHSVYVCSYTEPAVKFIKSHQVLDEGIVIHFGNYLNTRYDVPLLQRAYQELMKYTDISVWSQRNNTVCVTQDDTLILFVTTIPIFMIMHTKWEWVQLL